MPDPRPASQLGDGYQLQPIDPGGHLRPLPVALLPQGGEDGGEDAFLPGPVDKAQDKGIDPGHPLGLVQLVPGPGCYPIPFGIVLGNSIKQDVPHGPLGLLGPIHSSSDAVGLFPEILGRGNLKPPALFPLRLHQKPLGILQPDRLQLLGGLLLFQANDFDRFLALSLAV